MKKLFQCILPLISFFASAQPDGTFDPSFGNFGQVIAVSNATDAYRPLGKMQNDNKIVLPFLERNNANNPVLCAIRFNTDGSRDTTFGIDGVARSPLLAFRPNNLVIQPDQKIIVKTISSVDTQSIALIRFLPNGALDPEFLNQLILTPGVLIYDGLAIDKNNKIYVTGQDDEFIYLYRLTQSGVLDTSFNGTGFVTIQSPDSADVDITFCAVDKYNRIVISGASDSVFIVRVLEDGSLDTSFNQTGSLSFPVSYVAATAPVIDFLGRILLLVRNATDGTYEVSRVLDSGSIDASFGEAGFAALATPAVSSDIFGFIAVNSDQTILATNENYPGNNGILTRLTQNGKIDESFGNNGSVSIANPFGLDLFFPVPLIDAQNNIYFASIVDDATMMVNKLVQPSIISSTLSQALWLRYYNQL